MLPKIETSAKISRGSMISRSRYQLSRSFPVSSSPGFAKVADKVARGTRTVSLSRTKSRDYRDKSVAYRFPARFFRSFPRFFSASYALLFYSFASFFFFFFFFFCWRSQHANPPFLFTASMLLLFAYLLSTPSLAKAGFRVYYVGL